MLARPNLATFERVWKHRVGAGRYNLVNIGQDFENILRPNMRQKSSTDLKGQRYLDVIIFDSPIN